MQQKETAIKNQILDYLALRNIFCWLTNISGNWNNLTKSYYKNPRLMKGVSDILGILPDGKFLAIECKAEKGKLSEFQETFLNKINAFGGVAIVCRSIEDVDKFLADYL